MYMIIYKKAGDIFNLFHIVDSQPTFKGGFIMKKALSLFMAMGFILSAVPGTAYAYEDTEYTYEDTEITKTYVYTEDQDFFYNCVIVALKRDYSELNKEWTVEDFNVSNVTSVDDLTHMNMSEEEKKEYLDNVDFHQILRFNLEEQSLESVLTAISELEKCEQVLSAGPNYKPISDEIIIGDVNADNTLDVADCTYITQYLASPDSFPLTDAQKEAADVTGSGDGVTAEDALAIQKYLVGTIDTLG